MYKIKFSFNGKKFIKVDEIEHDSCKGCMFNHKPNKCKYIRELFNCENGGFIFAKPNKAENKSVDLSTARSEGYQDCVKALTDFLQK